MMYFSILNLSLKHFFHVVGPLCQIVEPIVAPSVQNLAHPLFNFNSLCAKTHRVFVYYSHNNS